MTGKDSETCFALRNNTPLEHIFLQIGRPAAPHRLILNIQYHFEDTSLAKKLPYDFETGSKLHMILN